MLSENAPAKTLAVTWPGWKAAPVLLATIPKPASAYSWRTPPALRKRIVRGNLFRQIANSGLPDARDSPPPSLLRFDFKGSIDLHSVAIT